MANLSQMTLNFLENLLIDNPGVNLFTSYFFADIANFNAGGSAGSNPALGGNPTRQQVLNAYQAQVDQAKYGVGGAASGIIFPVVFADPSTGSLSGKLSTSGNQAVGGSSANSGLPGQAPQNAITVTQASIAPTPAISNPADDNVPAGVFVAPPSYKQRVQVNTDVK
jgi:hypothetical protein